MRCACGAHIILDVGLHADSAKDLLSGLYRQIVIKVEHSLLPVSVRRLWACKTNSLCKQSLIILRQTHGEYRVIKCERNITHTALTGREACPLVAASELYVEIGYQSMNIVVSFHLQAERWREGQVLNLHGVDVHLLRNQENGLNKWEKQWLCENWEGEKIKIKKSCKQTLIRQAVLTSCLGSTTSTSGSVMATSLIQDMSKPYTFSHPKKMQIWNIKCVSGLKKAKEPSKVH